MAPRQAARHHRPIRRAIALPLQPLPWRPGDPSPPLPPGTAPPLLLLIDSRLPLPPGEILQAHLSPAEIQRHQAYRRPADRLRFLVGRASLRELLGHWLQQAPHTIRLEASAHGKPYCPGGPAFNVSHSGNLILLAFHTIHAVGVDVEQARPDLDWPPIARRMLPASEVEALLTLPEAQQPGAFLQAWCRLEARLKADGRGLAGRGRLGDGASSGGGLPPLLWDVAVPRNHAAAVAMARCGTPLRAHPAAAGGGDHPSPPA